MYKVDLGHFLASNGKEVLKASQNTETSWKGLSVAKLGHFENK